MEHGHPLVRDVFPDLVTELIALLEDEGERELAICAHDLRLVGDCGCGDDFCQSIRTAEHPQGQPYGAGHRCVPLLASTGMLVLDVVDNRIVYVEILDRRPMGRQGAAVAASAVGEPGDDAGDLPADHIPGRGVQ